MPDVLLGNPKPRLCFAPIGGVKTFGPAGVGVLALGAVDAFEWHSITLDVALAVDAEGKWIAQTVGLSVSRQAGKTELLLARALLGLLVMGEKEVVYSAHRVDTARKTFERIEQHLEAAPELMAQVRKIDRSNGKEAIRFHGGGVLKFISRAKGAGRGLSPQCLMLDEAQIMSKEAYTALTGGVSAQKNYQIWLVGTPPTDEIDGEQFTAIRNSALDGSDPRAAWIEYSAPDDAADNPGKREYWADANPAWGLALQTATIEREFAQWDLIDFLRDRLGMWIVAGIPAVIDSELWKAIADAARANSAIEGRISVGVDISPDRSTACVTVAAARADGRIEIDVVKHGAGVDWVKDDLRKLMDSKRVANIVLNGQGASDSLALEYKRERWPVIKAGTAEFAAACGSFYDSVADGTLSHFGNPVLDRAVENAVKRELAGRWAWARKSKTSDITPLCSATLALLGHLKARKKKRVGEMPKPRYL